MTDEREKPAHPFLVWEENFIGNMVRLRAARDMTQTEMAKSCQYYGLKFHQPTVQRIEAGERPVRLDEAHIIARVLGVELEQMTEHGAADAEQLEQIVKRLRHETSRLAMNLTELLMEWAYEVAELVTTLDGLDLQPGDQEPAIRWSLEWANRFANVAEELRSVIASAEWNAGNPDPDFGAELSFLSTVRNWTKNKIWTPDLNLEPERLMEWLEANRG